MKLSVWGAADEAYSFARWHRAVEREIESSGLAWTFLRPNGFMQNLVNHMGATIKAQGAIYQATADAPMSHIDARDIGAVPARVLTEPGHDGRAYALSGPQALSYGQMAEMLSAALGRRIEYVATSDEGLQERRDRRRHPRAPRRRPGGPRPLLPHRRRVPRDGRRESRHRARSDRLRAVRQGPRRRPSLTERGARADAVGRAGAP